MSVYRVFCCVGVMVSAWGAPVCDAASMANLPEDGSAPRQSAGRIRQTTSVENARADIVEPQEIHAGFVIIEGRYVSPPYVLQWEQGQAYLNGLPIPPAGRPPSSERAIGMRRMSQIPSRRSTLWMAEYLRRDGMLICAAGAPTVLVPVEQALAIFDVLLADKPSDARLESLLQVVPRWTVAQPWARLVETFDRPSELCDRLLALKHSRTESDAADAASDRPWTFLSALTMTGFVLAVWALGTLLSCRFPLRHGRCGMSASSVSCRQVVRLVLLIVVLNAYDLLCTLYAHNVGGLWELNPFAGRLLGYTSLIAGFKITLTVGAAILLLAARRHWLTQIGSWWAGVLYTILVVRWATFNSMFL